LHQVNMFHQGSAWWTCRLCVCVCVCVCVCAKRIWFKRSKSRWSKM